MEKISSARLVTYCIILKSIILILSYNTVRLDLPVDISLFANIGSTLILILLAFSVYRLVVEVSESENIGIPSELKYPFYGIIGLILFQGVQRLVVLLLTAYI